MAEKAMALIHNMEVCKVWESGYLILDMQLRTRNGGNLEGGERHQMNR